MSAPRAVARVRVVSTGSVRIRPEHVASNGTPELWWLMTSRAWTPALPINVYLVEHRDGLILFDTGQDRASVTDPRYFPRGPMGVVFDRLARFDIGGEETLPALLAREGYCTSDVTKVVLSHLHQDHVGGLRDLGGAEIFVAEREWQTLTGPAPLLHGMLRRHIDLPGLRWRRVPLADDPVDRRAWFDLAGDGSLMLVPTPGHTAGSCSLLVRDGPGDPLLLVGDLTYSCELLERGVVPGVGNRRRLRETSGAVRALAGSFPGLRVLAAHDPGAAASLFASGNAGASH